MSLYNPNTNIEVFDFSEALKRIKKGRKVSRRGWNGKSQYIQIVTNVVGYTSSGKVESNKAIGFFGTSGLQIGWLASQADMLAEDWYEVTDSKPSNTITKNVNATVIRLMKLSKSQLIRIKMSAIPSKISVSMLIEIVVILMLQ